MSDLDKTSEIIAILTEMVRSFSLRMYALQTLLVESGAVSVRDVERRIEEIRPVWDAAYGQILENPTEEERAARLRRLLESYEGPKQ